VTPIGIPRFLPLSQLTKTRKFALNLNIPFHTPEEYFLGDDPVRFVLVTKFNPRDYLVDPPATPAITPPSTPDMLLLVGCPAAGKSTFYRHHLLPLGYQHINQDTLRTRAKCVAEATVLLRADAAIAIDNTNADKATRRTWVDLARQFGRTIRCVQFTASPQLARHNLRVRALAAAGGIKVCGGGYGMC
jgi:bifunctional polynucleotide phosphatase/kinase